MNKRIKHIAASAVAASLLAASALALAQQAPKPETLIKWRQSAFQVVAWNSGRIKASIDGQYNKEEVIKAANTIAAISGSGLGSLFAPGTEQGKGWHETTAKPELFKNSARFAELGGNFNKEAVELTKVAATGDVASVKEQFGKLSRTCKACHDDFKSKD
ncbi:cytochrome c [Aquabacterium sp. CECT 9606]|uniref:c-type cytochrome n=1 Tax=Aquabacterium sp. CECT 9606 TaxID=2845822 RepID=UPI001E2A88E0|nr:cytochrome c [Aquabacterium sp. CECT 9606]CAH0352949.1 Cytochrome c' [Aquabacterium sp. CECT 9606]